MKRSIIYLCTAALICCTASASIIKGNNSENVTSKATSVQSDPTYELMKGLPMTDISKFKKTKDGKIVLFDGKILTGWRGYNRADLPDAWVVDDGAIHIIGHNDRGSKKGGDLIFAHKFKNFVLEFEWKVAKASNSGVFILVQEVKNQDAYMSAPEYQILDNVNHPDAKLGKNGNRKSASLYDMIPASPQNSKPFGEWNKGKITCKNGAITYSQNGIDVVKYHLWTKGWKELLDNSKFSKSSMPIAYELLMNCGGPKKEGFIGLQDHGDNVWYRNITVKELH